MVDDAHRLGFPLLAGSSLPVTWRLPDLELPLGCRIEEALMVGCGGIRPDGLPRPRGHAVHDRAPRGGETGVQAVQMVEGDAVWRAGEEGGALARTADVGAVAQRHPRRPDGGGWPHAGPGRQRRIAPARAKPAAYFVEYRDGLRTTLLMLNGAVSDFCFACRLAGVEDPQSTQFFLSPTPNVTYSACLVAKIDEMITTGRSPIPAERTLLAGGILESCLDSEMGGHARLRRRT